MGLSLAPQANQEERPLLDRKTAFWVVNDLPLEALKQSLDILLLWTSISALGGNELNEL